jgi:two-component system OmpR family response regulator
MRVLFMRILIVEDQREIAALIADRIRLEGFIPDRVGTISDALHALRVHAYPVMLLDRRLPDGDSVSIIPEVRRLRPAIRVLIVSALRSIEDKVDGLDSGADDYLTKPFDSVELLARIRASLRRPGASPFPPVVVGALTFDLNTRTVSIAGHPILLQKREMLMLEALMRRAERVVTHDTLIDEVYGLNEVVQFNVLKTLSSRLRQRLTELKAGVDVKSVRGVGYLIRECRD